MKQIFASLFSLLFGTSCLASCQTDAFTNLDVEAFATYISQTPHVIVLDVRTPEEFAEGHLLNALNINVKDEHFLVKAQAKLDPKKPIAVYCRSGRRSAQAAEQLAAKGYKVTNMSGGILEWQKKYKTVK